MGNAAFKNTTVQTGPHPWRRHLHRGWVDAQNGQGWPRDYDVMSRSEQIAYETGRLFVREAIVEGFPICVWRGDKAGAKAVDDLWNALCRKLGHGPVPPEWFASELAA